MNNDYPSPAKKKSTLNQPNIISVSLRFVLLAVLFGLGWKLLAGSVPSAFTAREYLLCGLIALPAAAILIQLIVWGLKWVKDERVSELGLHIVRFAVILFAVMLGIFVMLSIDYTNQYRSNISSELTEQALAGRIYIQHAIGDSLEFNAKETSELRAALDSMLVSDSDAGAGRNRCSVLYLFTDGQEVTYQNLDNNFDFIDQEHTVAAVSTSAAMLPSEDKELLTRVRNSGVVEFHGTGSGEFGALSAFSTVYTTSGKPVGVLEVRQSNNDLLNVFSFASLDLFLRMAAFICLFSFAFYGIMQLLDIALRPRNFDKSRSVLSCGREAARPILFFVTLTASLPLTLLLFSSSLRETVRISWLPEGIDNAAPAVIYLIGISLGYLAVRRMGARLTELPSNLALGMTVLCNLGLILLLDWDLFPALQQYNSYVTILALIFVSGVCYGISFSTIKKFQKQSDRLFGYDKYAYLCSCLGAITGTILGAVVMDYKSDLFVRVLMVIFSAVTTVMSIILLEDLDTTSAPDYVRSGNSGTSPGVIAASVPAAAIIGFVWVYICEFLQNKGYGAPSAAFCAVMPIIAFCFGNRLRLRSKGGRRTAAVVSILLGAASFIPMLISHSPAMAAASALAASFAVIFGSAALYSSLCKEERSRFAGVFMPLLLISMVLFAVFMEHFNVTRSLRQLLFTAIVCAGFAGLYLLISTAADIRAKSAAKTTALATYGASPDAAGSLREAKRNRLPKPEKEPKPEKPKKEKSRKGKDKDGADKTDDTGSALPSDGGGKDSVPEKPSDSAPVFAGPVFSETVPEPEPEPVKIKDDKKDDPLYTTPMDDGFASSPVFSETVPETPAPPPPPPAPPADEPPTDDIFTDDIPIILPE